MENFLAQLGGQQDMLSTLIWFAMFFVFAFFYPRMMVSQTVWSLEKEIIKLEGMAKKDRELVTSRIEARPSAKTRESVDSFMDFFAVSPVSEDPYGLIKKLDLVIRQADHRFKWFVDQVAPGKTAVEKANIKNALAGAMTTHQIAKILRHMFLLIKKYKILQLAMMVQMQMPLIMRQAKAASAATKAFSDGLPIGDGIGPLVAASLITPKAKLTAFKDEEFVVAKTKLAGRNVWIAKADGPGAGVGKPGKVVLRLKQKERINRIITVDAALRLEGEKAGSVAEGVGVALGGSVDRYEMEEAAVKTQTPLDAVAIKVSDEEALMPMKKVIFDAVPAATEAVKASLARSRKGDRILIMGVGNTCGVGNTAKNLEAAKKLVLKAEKSAKEKKD